MKLELTDDQEMKELFTRLERGIRAFGAVAFKPAFKPYSQGIIDIFQAEGPGWEPLRPLTQSIRRKLGYAPRHPILRRTNTLMHSLTDETMGLQSRSFPDPLDTFLTQPTPITVGNTITEYRDGADYLYEFSVADERFPVLHGGGNVGGYEIPARPMLPTGGSEARIAQVVEKELLNLLEYMCG